MEPINNGEATSVEDVSLSLLETDRTSATAAASAVSNPQEDDAVAIQEAQPLLGGGNSTGSPTSSAPPSPDPHGTGLGLPGVGVVRPLVRSRNTKTGQSPQRRRRRRRGVQMHRRKSNAGWCLLRRLCCFAQTKVVRCMHLTARVVLWSTILALSVGVIWYSYELAHNGYVL